MNKLFILCVLLACVLAHKHLKGNSKQHHKAQGVSFHSATFEMQNIGDQDYKLDPAVAKNWDDETKNLGKHHHKEAHVKPTHNKHSKANHKAVGKFVQLEENIVDVVDLSNNVGLVELKVTDVDGNIIQQIQNESPLVNYDEPKEKSPATEKLLKDMAEIKKDEETVLAQVDYEQKGPALEKLETDMDSIMREDQEEELKKESDREDALKGTDDQQ
ncbi:hypothetical protein pb186bvf_006480 [Paramecium bursaria]